MTATAIDARERLPALMEAAVRAPGDSKAHRQLAEALAHSGSLRAAIVHALKAVELDERDPNALVTLGAAYMMTGQHAAATEAYERALRLSPTHLVARWNYALDRLLHGDWKRGWELFRGGGTPWNRRPIRTYLPAWDGKPLPEGSSLCLWFEAGLGDTLFFLRYCETARRASRCHRLIVEAQEDLCGYIRDMPGIDAVYPRRDDWAMPEECHHHAALMDVPGILGETLTGGRPYLPRPEVSRSDRFRVGACWRGNPQHARDAYRSMGHDDFDPIIIDGPEWVCLQKGHPLAPPMPDIATTAGIIAGLDLVVTVDTMVAHLAAGMGVPTWILLPVCNDWRWGVGRTDTPFYDCVRLYRQTELGVWSDVVEHVRADLAVECRQRAGGG